MKTLPVILLTLFLAACGPLVVKTYTGDDLPMKDIAVIKGGWDYRQDSDIGQWGSRFVEYSVDVRQKAVSEPIYYSLQPAWNTKDLTQTLFGYPYELHLLPGLVRVRAQCKTKFAVAFPEATLEVLAGYTYELYCKRTSDPSMVTLYIYLVMPSDRYKLYDEWRAKQDDLSDPQDYN